jgi:phospholipase C
MPVQESGTRPARPVPYTLQVAAAANLGSQIIALTFGNTGAKAAVFQVRSANVLQPPRSYTVSPNATLTDTWEFGAGGAAAYDLSVYGPNGFFRHYVGGTLGLTATNLDTSVTYDTSADSVTLLVKNVGALAAAIQVVNVYSGEPTTHTLVAGATFSTVVSLAKYAGWYDFIITVDSDPTFEQELAGHLETGKASTTDPAMS